MSDATRRGHERRTSIASAIDEALAGAVARERVRPLLEAALAACGVREIPEDTATLRLVVGSIVAEVEHVVGADAAQLVADELGALVRIIARIEALADGGKAQSGAQPRDVHRAITAPTIAPELVLLLTTSPDLGPRLRQLLGGATKVEDSGSIGALRSQMLRARPARPVVVIDARGRSAEAAVASSAQRASGTTALVLWGDAATSDPWAWTEPDRVVRCSDEVELVDLACLLRTSLARVA